MLNNKSLKFATLATALFLSSSPLLAMDRPLADELFNTALQHKSKSLALEACMAGMRENKENSPARSLWLTRFKTLQLKDEEHLDLEAVKTLEQFNTKETDNLVSKEEVETLQKKLQELELQLEEAKKKESKPKTVSPEEQRWQRQLEELNKIPAKPAKVKDKQLRDQQKKKNLEIFGLSKTNKSIRNMIEHRKIVVDHENHVVIVKPQEKIKTPKIRVKVNY